jgi:hypothetical protein
LLTERLDLFRDQRVSLSKMAATRLLMTAI